MPEVPTCVESQLQLCDACAVGNTSAAARSALLSTTACTLAPCDRHVRAWPEEANAHVCRYGAGREGGPR